MGTQIYNSEGHNRYAAALFVAAAILSCGAAAENSHGPSLRPDVPFREHLQRQFRLRDGLPSNWIYDVVQTRDGYVWIATHNGLARYDGLRFRVFNRSDTPQLPANDTRVLYESRDGSLWIGTVGGLARYQTGRPGTFEEFETFEGNSIHAIFEDRDNTLWIGTREETWARSQGRPFEVVDAAPTDVKAICEDQHGTLWFGSDSGLYTRQDSKLKRIAHDRLPKPTEADSGISAAGVNVLFADDHGGVWIGANRGLLYIKDGRFEVRGREIGQRQVYDVLKTRNGGLYVATRHGLQRSVDGGEFSKLPSEELTSCIAEDREGGLWVGHSVNRGLRHYRNGETGTLLTDHVVNCVHEDPEGNMWFGSISGLHCLRDGRITNYGIADGLPNARVQTIAQGSENSFWIGTHKGFARWSGTELSTVVTPPELAQLNIASCFEDSVGTLWFALGSRGGYVLQHGALSKLQALDHGKINWFYEESPGQLWIGHEYGLFHSNDDEIKQVIDPAFDRLNNSHFVCHYAAKDGTLWMGTAGGIVRYQPGRFDAITSADGLAADYLDRLGEDSQGNLWLGGRDGFFYVGISELNQLSGGRLHRVTSHRVEQLEGVNVSSCHPKSCLATDGTMWIAGGRGVIRLAPDPLPRSPVPPSLHIEQVRIDGNTVKAETHCEFLAGHRRLAIDFAAPTFANPQDVRVNYRLDGHDNDWIDAGDDRVAYYTDLRPGAYTFRVTSRSGDGDWLEDEQTLAFAVKPRWWETAWFRASTALGLIGLAICSTWGYTRRIRRRNAVLRNEIHERKRVEEKARDYLRQLARINRAASMGEMGTSIAHEVNQPLFAIVSNAQTAKRLLDRQEPDIDEVRDALSDIVDDGNRASSIIKHIRSLVRNEQQPTEKLDLNQVALEALEFAGPEMRVRGLSLKSDLAGQLPPVEGNSIELQQVILNLIVNGAQAMAEIGDGPRELWLTTCTQDGFVELSVKDNGTGFDQKTMDRLFEPFFTTKPQGTGMGLAINRTIIEAHGGRIWATLNDELGATFHVRLPAVTGAVT